MFTTKLKKRKMVGQMIRGRAKWAEEKKPTRYFCSFEIVIILIKVSNN